MSRDETSAQPYKHARVSGCDAREIIDGGPTKYDLLVHAADLTNRRYAMNVMVNKAMPVWTIQVIRPAL